MRRVKLPLTARQLLELTIAGREKALARAIAAKDPQAKAHKTEVAMLKDRLAAMPEDAA